MPMIQPCIKSGSDLNQIQNKLQENLFRVQKWCTVSNMSLHPTKTKCMLIRSKYTAQNLLRFTFSFDDLMLKTNRLKKYFFIKIG